MCECDSLHPSLSLSDSLYSLFFLSVCLKKCFQWQAGRFLRPCARRGCLSSLGQHQAPSGSHMERAGRLEEPIWISPCFHRRPAYLLAILMPSPPITLKLTGSRDLVSRHCVLKKLLPPAPLAGVCECVSRNSFQTYIPTVRPESQGSLFSLSVVGCRLLRFFASTNSTSHSKPPTHPNPLTINSFEIVSSFLAFSHSYSFFPFTSSILPLLREAVLC